jgi:hypothetical protein
MNAPYQANSKDLFASIERMRTRTWLDGTAAAFESGTAETWPARPDGNRHERRRKSNIARCRPQRSPDKQKSYERRHRLAFSGPLPPHLAARFTVGHMSCLRVVGDEYRGRGHCCLTLDEIAARAGVCRKTAQRAMWAARDEGLLTIKGRRLKGRRKHLPNVVRVTSPEWLSWLARGSIRAKMKTGHSSPTTVTRLVDDDDDGDARRENCIDNTTSRDERPQSGRPSKEAIEFANELASIAGHRRNQIPEAWRNADPPQVVQSWLNTLAASGANLCRPPVEMLRLLTMGTMRRKPDPRPPHSPRYFTPTIKSLVDDCARSRAMIVTSQQKVAA